MKRLLAITLLLIAAFLTACGSSTAQPSSTPPQKTPVPLRTPVPTSKASFPVCNAKVTNAPCVEYASIQDAAEGQSYTGSKVSTSIANRKVQVVDDITYAEKVKLGPLNALPQIQLQCFNIQEALWYGLYSTINPGGGQTFRKSPFAEVKVSFIDQHKGNAPFAGCRLTSAGVEKIDRAGMWDDGDYTGAWPLYDETYYT